ncbi:MAG: nucleoside 2-deoxyribosyltransferase domain-containing protein [Pyrinomonadaceae bacterium]
MTKQIFLGGACGETDWRQKIAIPLFEAGGITYYNPQLGIGEWTEECEAAEKAIVLIVFGIELATGLINWYLMDPGFFGG